MARCSLKVSRVLGGLNTLKLLILTSPCNYVSTDSYTSFAKTYQKCDSFYHFKILSTKCRNLSLEKFYFVRRQSFSLDIYLSPSLQFNIYCRALSPLVPFPLSLYFCGKSQQWREIELRLVDRTPHLARVLSLPSPV